MLINWMLKKLSITEEDDVEPSRRRVFIKILKSYEDVREVFAKYKSGEECIISLKKYVESWKFQSAENVNMVLECFSFLKMNFFEVRQ